MEIISEELSAPMTIEKLKFLGAVLELPAKQHCQSSPFTAKMGQMDGPQDFDFFQLLWVLIIHLS